MRSAARAGRLRHRVALHAPTIAEDALGQPIESDGLVGSYWAEVEPLSGAEAPSPAGERLRGEATHRVTVRFGVPAGPDGWFAWRGRRLDVIAIPADAGGRGRVLEILCREVADGPG